MILRILRGRRRSFENGDRQRVLTTWLIAETLDWRMVTASPIDGFLLRAGADLKDLLATEVSVYFCPTLFKNLDNISFIIKSLYPPPIIYSN